MGCNRSKHAAADATQHKTSEPAPGKLDETEEAAESPPPATAPAAIRPEPDTAAEPVVDVVAENVVLLGTPSEDKQQVAEVHEADHISEANHQVPQCIPEGVPKEGETASTCNDGLIAEDTLPISEVLDLSPRSARNADAVDDVEKAAAGISAVETVSPSEEVATPSKDIDGLAVRDNEDNPSSAEAAPTEDSKVKMQKLNEVVAETTEDEDQAHQHLVKLREDRGESVKFEDGGEMDPCAEKRACSTWCSSPNSMLPASCKL